MTEPVIRIELTSKQQSLLLTALAEKSVETDVYLAGYRDDAKPGPMDTCCPAHQMRFDERQRQRTALVKQRKVLKKLTRLIENPQSIASVPLDQITLMYRDAEGNQHEQPLQDITTAGTLIDPENGDDLDLERAIVKISRSHVDDTWDNTIPREIAGALECREDSASTRAAAWLHANENEDAVWQIINRAMDAITELSAD
jgi:hypothetical protein